MQEESKDPDSVLAFYQQVIRLRKSEPALQEGTYIALNESDENVLFYMRQGSDGTVLVVLNFSASPRNSDFDLRKQGFPSAKVKGLLQNGQTCPIGFCKW